MPETGVIPSRAIRGQLDVATASGPRSGWAVLPTPPAPLVGREPELLAVGTVLRRADVRLLTLTGPGGVGKTRLAMDLARAALADFADGVVMVDLAVAQARDQVVETIARALDVDLARSATGEGSVLTRVTDVLRDRHLLLLLDTVERVPDIALDLPVLLARCPRLTVLTTSRSRLHLRAEHVVPIDPLPLPDQGDSTIEGALASPAVALFLERAGAAGSGFELTGDNREDVVALCRRSDGLPLGIELIAARAALLSPAIMLRRLGDGLAIEGARDLPARQRTLHATVAWSHELLDREGQDTLAWLSTCAGGFSYELAREIVTRAGVAGADPLDALVSLAANNLITVRAGDPGTGSGTRYGMLEAVRAFAAERLAASGQAPRLRRAHARAVLALIEALGDDLLGPDQAVALDTVERELGNLRVALATATETGDAETALRLGAAAVRFWDVRNYRGEGVAWLETALAMPAAATVDARYRAAASHAAGTLAEGMNDYPRAQRAHRVALSLWQGLGDARGLAATYSSLGTNAHDQGDLDEAVSLHRQAVEWSRTAGDDRQLARSLGNLGVAALFLGDDLAAAAHWRESLPLLRRIGDHRWLSTTLGNLGVVTLRRGDRDGAIEMYGEALALARQIGDRAGTTSALINLGELALASGESDRAGDLYREALDIARQTGEPRLVAVARWNLGMMAVFAADLAAGTEAIGEAIGIFAAIGDRLAIAEALEEVGARVAGSPALDATLAEAAGRLLGAAATFRTAPGPLPGMGIDPPTRDILLTVLDEATLEYILADGRAWSEREASDGLLALLPRVPTLMDAPAPGETGWEALTPAAPGGDLTKREREVLRSVALGLSNAEIAERLYLSPRTVATHLHRIYAKVGVSSRAGATRFALDNRLC